MPVDQNVIRLYNRFTHDGMNRRDFLDRLTELAGSTAAAVALLPLLQNNYAQAAIVAPDDGRLVSERVSYDLPKAGSTVIWRNAPKRWASGRAVIVIHENRGLNPHIEDVARRLAVEGYLVLAPDLRRSNGGTPPEEDRARELHQKTEARGHDRGGAGRHPAIMQKQRGIDRQGRRNRVLLRRRGVVNRMAAGNPEARRRRAVLRHADPGRGDGAGDQGAAAAAIRGERRGTSNKGIGSYEDRARPANNKKYAIYIYPARITPSTTTPAPRATTRRRPNWPGAARSPSCRASCAPPKAS